MKLVSLVLLFIPLGALGFLKCPDQSLLKPCKCTDYGTHPGTFLECKDFANLDDLQNVFDNSLDYSFIALTFCDSVIPHLNTTWFSTKKSEKLFVMNMTLIDLLDDADTNVPSLHEITIEKTKILRRLRWKQFRPFTELKILTVREFSVKKLGKEFRNNVAPSLEMLYIERANLKALDDEAFQGKTKLEQIFFTSNQIKALKSSFFKDQRNTLKIMQFRYNPIESISEDLFEEFTTLESVDLVGCYIKTLPTNLQKFRGIFEISENPLVCDCAMSWILQRSHDLYIPGTCDSPPSLQSREIMSLREEDFGACV